jgi:hypothetical protein
MNRNLHSQIEEKVFTEYSETIWVYLKKTNTKGANYNPYYETGMTKTRQSPIPVKAIVSSRLPWTLQQKEIGLFTDESISCIIKKSDVNAIKFADKIKYNEVEYSLYSKALGNRSSIQPRGFGFYRVVLFRKGSNDTQEYS